MLFPALPGEELMIGIPLTLPMGWAKSPLAFCTATKTTADLASVALAVNVPCLHTTHCLNNIAESTQPVRQQVSTVR